MSKKEITLAAYAHHHRQAPTDSEARLWSVLRSSAQGARFRRQVPLLGFIVDFLAPRPTDSWSRSMAVTTQRDSVPMRAGTTSCKKPATVSYAFRLSLSCEICRARSLG